MYVYEPIFEDYRLNIANILYIRRKEMDSLYGELGVIAMRGCDGFINQVDEYLKEWRRHDDDKDFKCMLNARASAAEKQRLCFTNLRAVMMFIFFATVLTTVRSLKCTA